MKTISFVLCEKMLATCISLPIEMLHTAEGAALGANRRAERLKIQLVAPEISPVTTSSGFQIKPELTLDEVKQTDLVYLPALWRNPRVVLGKNPAIIPWLQIQAHQGAIISSVGTGSCFMAEAGLLDHKPATTHWHYFDQFERDYPQIELKRQYFITQAGNLYCAASVNAMADLTVHFIEQLYDKKIAMHVQRHFSHEIRRDYKSIGYFEGNTSHHPDEAIAQAQTWLQDNYAQEIKIDAVASKFDMSVRTFNRRFKQALGYTPLHYIQEIRINIAKDLLKTSNLSIREVAQTVGYQDMGHFAQLFKKFLNTTPSDYRTTVRSKMFTSGGNQDF